jgi:hypothetical protein
MRNVSQTDRVKTKCLQSEILLGKEYPTYRKMEEGYNNNNNIYLTAIEFSPGGSGFDTYTRNLNLSV